jgi:site-specific DNA recombinase
VKLLVCAHQAKTHLEKAETVATAAQAMGLNQRYFTVLLKLSFLAPDIQAAILDGHQPLQLNRQRVAHITSMPVSWHTQRQMLGFT